MITLQLAVLALFVMALGAGLRRAREHCNTAQQQAILHVASKVASYTSATLLVYTVVAAVVEVAVRALL